jgi:hypothetical protein
MVLTGLETLKKDQFSEESKRENTNQDIFWAGCEITMQFWKIQTQF